MKRLVRIVCVAMLTVMVFQTVAMASPGQEFYSIDSAALDFARNYNDNSIREKREYGSAIYRKSNGRYSYTVPNIGNRDSVSIRWATSRQGQTIAMVHSHGNSDVSHIEEYFSVTDYVSAINAGIKYTYVATPEGYLKRGEPQQRKLKWYESWFMKKAVGVTITNTTVVSRSMPHDRTAFGQMFLFKHWFGRHCSNCAN